MGLINEVQHADALRPWLPGQVIGRGASGVAKPGTFTNSVTALAAGGHVVAATGPAAPIEVVKRSQKPIDPERNGPSPSLAGAVGCGLRGNRARDVRCLGTSNDDDPQVPGSRRV